MSTVSQRQTSFKKYNSVSVKYKVYAISIICQTLPNYLQILHQVLSLMEQNLGRIPPGRA